MLHLAVFIIAGAIAAAGFAWATSKPPRSGWPRPESIVFVVAVVAAGLIGSLYLEFSYSFTRTTAPILPPGINLDAQQAQEFFGAGFRTSDLRVELVLLLLAASLYVLSAVRGAWGLPPWIADVLTLGAAYVAVTTYSPATLAVLQSPGGDAGYNLGPWATGFTVAWMWLIARMTAGLNRVPQVAGGYLGLVGLTLLYLLMTGNRQAPFAANLSAALAGAGLATLPFAFKKQVFNLSWSTLLTMGFLLAIVASVGLLRNTAIAILALFVFAFGLPLLDVSFYRLRAMTRGRSVTWEEQRLRLHEALIRRGVSPTKVAAIYLMGGATLCLAGVLAEQIFSMNRNPLDLALRLIGLAILLFAGFVAFFSLTRLLMRRQEGEEIPDEVEAFGVKITPVTMSEAISRIEEFVKAGTPHHVVTSDANAILRAQEDPEYAAIVQNAHLITPDGYGVVWGARLLNLPIYERVTGVDMVTGICELAAKNGYSIYILGSEPGVAATAAQNLKAKYPGLTVAGTHHGYWRKDGKEAGLSVEEADIRMADAVRAAKPDVLFVAMGIPMQEKFIAAQFQRMQIPVSLGVGGSFDVYSGKFERAPVRVQRMGLEWLYRVYIDPSRWNRMGYVPRFMLLALRTWLFGGPRKPNRTA